LRHPLSSGEVFLVGTSHISAASAQQVRDVVGAVRPQHVVVELCESRRRRLEAASGDAPAASVLPGPGGVPRSLMELLEAFYRLLRAAGLDPGADMLAALRAGRDAGAELHCGDVEKEVTGHRLTAAVTSTDMSGLLLAMQRPDLRADLQVLAGDQHIDLAAVMRGSKDAVAALAASAERMKDREKVRRLIRVMDALAPRVAEALLHCRDAHIAKLLRGVPFSATRTVCVVGMAHMDGIARRYADPSWRGDPELERRPAALAGPLDFEVLARSLLGPSASDLLRSLKR